MPDLRTLTVTLVSAKEIMACDKGGTSDPFCKLELFDLATSKACSGESFKSKTKKKTLAPTWDEAFTFGKKGCNLESRSQPQLVLNMMDSDTFSSDDMGRVTIPLSDLPQTSDVTEKWYNLTNTEKATNVTGSVCLRFQYSAPLLTSMPVDMNDPPMSVTDDDPSGKCNELHILLISATGCKVMDKNMLSKGGSSDPMMTFDMGGDDKQKSSVKKKNLAPRWDEKFKIQVSADTATLKCVMDDHDTLGGNDFMGQFLVPLKDLKPHEEARQWYQLTEQDGSTEHDIGSVLLSLKWIHNKELISPVDQPIDMAAPPFPVTDHDATKLPNELNIMILKAYNLKIMDKNLLSKGGSTDPLFTMAIGEEIVKTTCKKKNLNPEYNETFTLGMRNNDAAKMVITCDDYDMGSGNDFVGQCLVDLAPLDHRQEVRQWYALGDTDNNVGADIGHVLVAVRWVFNPERLSPVDQPLDWNNPAFECVDVPEEPVLNELNIFLIKAYGLKVMDKNMFSKGGSSDPIVTMTIGDEIMKSTVKKKTLEPEYNEKFTLPIKSKTATLTVQVDDYDLVGDNDFMGKFEVPMEGLADRQEHRQWYPLCSEDGTESADVGHVLVAFKWIHNPARLSPVDVPVDMNNPPFEVVDADFDKAPNELNLFLIKAYGLKVMDKNMFSKGGSSDPIVTMSAGDEKQKSTVKKKTLEPEYNEMFKFPIKRTAGKIKVQVDDYDLVGDNDFMGGFELNMADFENRQEIRTWYHLCAEDGTHGADIGSVLIAARWVFNPELLSPVDQDINFADPYLDVSKHADNKHGFPLNELVMVVIQAYGLKIMDKNMFSKGGSSDPMCTVVCGAEVALKTEIVKKSLAPVWNKEMRWRIEPDRLFDTTVIFVVDDYDMASGNDFMGKFELNTNELNDGVERRQWFNLKPESGEETGEDFGHVLVGYRLIHNPEFAPEVEVEEVEEYVPPPVELTPFELRLKKCMEALGGESLNLAKLGLSEMPAQVSTLSGLKGCNLRGNQFTWIGPEFFSGLHQLSALNVSMNAFSVLPDGLSSLSNLVRLVVSDNQLSSLPVDLFAMPKLAELYAERNYIRELPKGISVAMCMKKLMLGGNQLTAIPDEVGEMPALETFDVRNNPLNEGDLGVGVRKIYDSTVLHISKSSRRGLVSRALKVRTMVEENRERQLRLFAEQEKAAKKNEAKARAEERNKKGNKH